MNTHIEISGLIFLSGLLIGCATTRKKFAVNAALMGEPIRTTVDSSLVREFIEGSTEASDSPRVRFLLEKYRDRPVDSATLKELADESSVDFGAAYFIHRVWENSGQRALQKRFYETVQEIRNPSARVRVPGRDPVEPESYVILFVPGLLYESKPETKGDLAGPRRTLSEEGFRTELVKIKEAGTVEENGRIIADAIRKHRTSRVILVSTSKGGPDVAFALGTALMAHEASHVRAWVSVGGALHGSRLADKTRQGLEYWPLRLYGFFKGIDVPALVRSMTIEQSETRFQRQTIPDHIYILHYVSVPFSGSVIKEVREPYEYMRQFGPNDGIVLLPEQILKNGHVVLAIGFDHWFRDPEIDLKTLALTRLVFEKINTVAELEP